MRFRRGLIAGLSLVATTGLIVAPAAGAAKKSPSLKVRSATATSPGATAPGLLTATAVCPPKTKAVGGGWTFAGPAPDDLGLVRESVRVGTTAWQVSANPNDFGVTVTAIAYCAKVKGAITEVQVPATLAGDPLTGAAPEASCGSKKQLLSGGFSTTQAGTGFTVVVYENARQRSGAWGMKVLRGSADTPGPVTAIAYCVKKPQTKAVKKSAIAAKKQKPVPRPLREVFASATLPATQYEGVTGTTGPCPGKRTGVSGGFIAPVPSNASVAAFTEARWVGDAWSVRAVQFTSATTSAPIQAIGYCA